MAEVFDVLMLRASEGDSLVLRYGARARLHHIVIDLGRTGDYKANRAMFTALGAIELLVISHIDADHIAGAMPLVGEADAPFAPADVWFNAYHHLVDARDSLPQDAETFGAEQGEKLSRGIAKFHWPWNLRTNGRPLSIEQVPQPIALPSGLKITLLSPDNTKLAELEPRWQAELKKAGLRPFDPDEAEAELEEGIERFGGLDVEKLAAVPFKPDKSKPNGSSIAFLAEYAGRRVMLLADAHPDLIDREVAKLASQEPSGRLRLDLLKVSHHGSAANTSPRLLQLVDCVNFAFSTNGTHHAHPDPETIARILINDPGRDKRLYFNFRQENAAAWDLTTLKEKWKYETMFPDHTHNGQLTIEVPAG